MKMMIKALAGAGLLALAACGGEGDDALGDEVADAAEQKADALEEMADNTSGAQADALEARADAVEDMGEAKEEAIDEADVDADALAPAPQEAEINGM